MLDSRLWRRFDWLLLAAVVLLTAFGVAMIYSATRNEGNPAVERSWLDQAITAVIGLTILLLVSIFDYTLLRGLAIPLYVGIVAALALVLVAGVERQGARRWFDEKIIRKKKKKNIKNKMKIKKPNKKKEK
jgi:cell division protein FtsW (lipid II flippase)